MTDTEFALEWRALYDGIRRTLAPYVQDALLDELAARIVADQIAAPGWRPPIRPAPDVIAEARAARTRQALTSRTGEER
mgnify:CR=1 FL=1